MASPRAEKNSNAIQDTTFDLTFHSPGPRGFQERHSSGDESEKETKPEEIDILKQMKIPIGDDSEITHTHMDYGTYKRAECLETKLIDAIKRNSQYLRKWETSKFKEKKSDEELKAPLMLDRATLLCKNFHIPEKVLRKCRGTDHKLIFELVVVEGAKHFHKVMAQECPEVDMMLGLMTDLLRNKLLPELLNHARHCDKNTLHDMIQERLNERTLVMEHQTLNFNQCDEIMSIMEIKELKKQRSVEIPQILDNSAVQITKSLNQRIQEMAQLKQELYEMLSELDSLERSVGSVNQETWRPYQSKWEGQSVTIGERLDSLAKFS